VNTVPPHQASSQQPALRRGVGFLGVVTFGAGTAIGVSIFSVLAPAARTAGSGLLVAIVLAALPMIIYALVYSFLSSALPKSGASYEWPRQFIHPVIGFLIAWLRIISNVGAIVVLAFVLVSYLRSAIDLPLKPSMAAAITFAFILNYLGISIAARAQTVLMAMLLVVLAAFVFWGAPQASLATIGSPWASGWIAIAAAVPLMITLFMGIESAAEIGEEVKEAERTIPRGIAGAVVLTTVVYAAVASTALGLLGPRALASSSAPLLDAARMPFGRLAVPLILTAATISILKTLNATTLVFSRSIFAMGRSEALPRILGSVHPRFGTPHVALALCYLMAMAGLLLPSSLTFLLLSVNVPTVLKYMASSLCSVRIATHFPFVMAQARLKFDRRLVIALGSLGIAIGFALLGVGATADIRPYELVGLWCLVGLLVVFFKHLRCGMARRISK
jgi:APA family basic amino acid/polyamine antiporter